MLFCGKEMSLSPEERKAELAASAATKWMRWHSFGWQSSDSYRSQHKRIAKKCPYSTGIQGESRIRIYGFPRKSTKGDCKRTGRMEVFTHA